MKSDKKSDRLKAYEIRAIHQHFIDGSTKKEAYLNHIPMAKALADKSLNVLASKFFKRPEVIAEMTRLTKVPAKELNLSARSVLLEAAKIAMFDPRRLCDEHGKILPISKWPDDVAGAIASVRYDKDGAIKEVKAWDKNAALDKLFRNFGLYETDNQQKGQVGEQIKELSLHQLEELANQLTLVIDSAGDVTVRPAHPALGHDDHDE
jgi:phage terminase small subunit